MNHRFVGAAHRRFASLAAAGLLVTPAARAPHATRSRAECEAAAGIWVVYGGKAQYRLEQKGQIPAGNLVSLLVTPAGELAPVVTLRTAKDPTATDVAVVKGDCGWTAQLPTLAPLVAVEVRVQLRSKLTKAGSDSIRQLFDRMLQAQYKAWEEGRLRRGSLAQFALDSRRELGQAFPPATTLPRYQLTSQASTRPVVAELSDLLADGKARNSFLGIEGVARALPALKGALALAITKKPAAPMLAKLQAVERALSDAGPVDRPEDRSHVALTLMQLDRRPIPLEADVLAALRNAVAGTPDTSRIDALSADSLALPSAALADLFTRDLASVEERSFTPTTAIGGGIVDDLARYGTVEYVQGQTFSTSESVRGLLAVSFYPSGPEPRTPTQAEGAPPQLALALGYSVTGGGSDTTQFYYGGLALRVNRALAVHFGWVAPRSGGGLRCCFLGLAGDLSVLPFLKNIFVLGSGGTP
ncbi:MAG: hypothetical protein HY275_15305 [Gemmatimonadetes bacterium]|nr:hypothetical protein [Gemmatimonadota bacterium]